jgi:curved DNA-binding protein CbpA
MAPSRRDPYAVLGVSSWASDEDLRAAYRRLVQLHHPDHNGGSAEATRRFEEVQVAYTEIREQREKAPRRARGAARSSGSDPNLEQRLAELERRLREARAQKEQALRAARERAAQRYKRPSDEELGYVHTDDSFSKILDDASAELSDRLSQARDHPVGKRLADMIEKLGEKLSDDPPRE